MALRKVRNNLDRLFDKNLTDLIRGIRNNKENEAKYIAACMEEIKAELRQESSFVKANAVEKLAYLQMLGYDISWAAFNIIEVMASTRFNEKRIGYMAATQCFTTDNDALIMMTTNMIRKDLQSTNLYDVGTALSGLACFATPDLARDLVNDVVNLLSSSRVYVRKKAVLVLYKIFLKYPESLRPTFPRLKDKLEDPDPGVQSAAVNVICELARKNPRNYLFLEKMFFKLMNTSSNNWMLIKIIKLFGSLVPLEAKLGKKLLEPLTNLINSTSAMSLLYECINTVIAVLISISSEFPGDFTASIQLCVQKLGVLIEDSDQNLKYLGLLAMGRILQTHPKAVQAHKDIVLRCLDDKDESIRLRALDLLYGMVSRKNIMEIVKKLMEHVDLAEGSFYRDELLAKIIEICSHNNYQYINNFEWYISVLVEMTKVEGSKHGVKIAEQIQDVTVRVQSIRHFSVSQMALLVENAHLLLSGNAAQRNNVSEVLLAAAWICGEYSEHVRDVVGVLESMLRIKMSLVPGALLSIYIQTITKLYSVLLTKHEKENDWDAVESLDNLILSKLPEFEYTDHLEAQERACNLIQILKFIEKQHASRTKMGDAFAMLFEGELNPVAAKAQKRVPVPEGLDLDAYIYEPEPDSELSESESEPDVSFPTMTAQSPIYDASEPSYPSPKQSKKSKKAEQASQYVSTEESRRQRQLDIDSNPYYVKSDKKAPTATKKTSNVNSRGGMNRSESLLTAAAELQSPLEIPGVIGLDRYLKQQSSTMSWKTAKSEREKSKKGKRKGKKKRTQSSSDEGGDPVVVHHVNRDDGEMPEGAISTDEENEGKNGRPGLSDEFKALDMDLDMPLRADETLFVPQPYHRPEEVDLYTLPTSRPAQAVPTVQNGEKKVKKLKKKAKQPAEKPKKKTKPAVEKTEKPRKRIKSEKSVELNYTSISSTGKPSKEAAANAAELIVAEPATTSANGAVSHVSRLQSLGQNGDLSVFGKVDAVITSGPDETTEVKGVALIKFKNRGNDVLRRLELSVYETDRITLDTSAGVIDSTSIKLPFELTPKSINEHTLHLKFAAVDQSQKLKVTLMYCVEKADGIATEDQINFNLTIPAIRFLVYATIGATSYAFILANDDLACASEKAASTQPLKAVIDEITGASNFSVVEFHDSAVSLYAHSATDAPVCVLVKKLDAETYGVSVKCSDSELAKSVSNDLKDLVEAHEEAQNGQLS
uniref:AP-3 complex subunit delta n=1 Tax=Panagrellus redivivus TaxID=6233 RepID=A0A7E4V9H3_PANRE